MYPGGARYTQGVYQVQIFGPLLDELRHEGAGDALQSGLVAGVMVGCEMSTAQTTG